ncbi:placenta-specific gene 8 protein-like [Coregonus clupeaformis]|uniref:placenta-specific gene 8 protein-like n=1 Tax=Coregonus clupeaformis TaxID=59861 RepID=UPI001BE040CC|nr:placenta-specific gene 8 protein-like [Coregonus clupeaformis]
MAVVINQPTSYAPSDFQTGLCGTCNECGRDCYGYWCFPCLGCSIASDMNECCLCGPTMAMRTMYRTRFGVQGSLCGDFCAILWCRLCSTCQLKRDIDLRKEQGIF